MFFRKTLSQQFIMNSAREWDVYDSTGVNMSQFGAAEAELPTAETMGVGGDVRPDGDFLLELAQERHSESAILFSPAVWMMEGEREIRTQA